MGILIEATADDVMRITGCTYEQADRFNKIVEEEQEKMDGVLLPSGFDYRALRNVLNVYSSVGAMVIDYVSDHDSLNEWHIKHKGHALYEGEFDKFPNWRNIIAEALNKTLTEYDLRCLLRNDYLGVELSIIDVRVCTDGTVVYCDMGCL